jgi:hypothetical protein
MRRKRIKGFISGTDKMFFRKTHKYIVAIMKHKKLYKQDEDDD